jgi:glyoxylase-like metal-dependent hydrolase (beta-lactamase superfamily II)
MSGTTSRFRNSGTISSTGSNKLPEATSRLFLPVIPTASPFCNEARFIPVRLFNAFSRYTLTRLGNQPVEIAKRMKDLRICPAALIIFALAGLVCAQNQNPLVRSGRTREIAEHIYVIPDQRVNLVPNIGIIVGRDGVLVVDTGMGPKNADTVLGEVTKITSERIAYLTVTHFHPEHGMGAQSFPVGTTIIYPMAQKTELVEKGTDIIKMFNGFSPEIADLLKPVRITMPTVTFAEEAEVNLGDFPVQLLYWGPAHTRGDEFVFLPKQSILFGGDVVVNRFFPIMPDSDASGTNWIRMLERLQKLNPAIVVPGHGEVGDASLITAMHAYLVFVRDRVQQLKSEGSSLADVEKRLEPEVRAKYKDWDNPNWIKNAVDNFYNSSAR